MVVVCALGDWVGHEMAQTCFGVTCSVDSGHPVRVICLAFARSLPFKASRSISSQKALAASLSSVYHPPSLSPAIMPPHLLAVDPGSIADVPADDLGNVWTGQWKPQSPLLPRTRSSLNESTPATRPLPPP